MIDGENCDVTLAAARTDNIEQAGDLKNFVTWWRRDMESYSTSLTSSAGNPSQRCIPPPQKKKKKNAEFR